MAPHEYQPIDTNAGEIRLLTLFPKSYSPETTISLEVVLLTPKNTPQYEALSYTWGSSNDPVEIRIKDLRDTTLSITQNLATALSYLRLLDEPRVLWIDAICIDQENMPERSQQVQKFGDIFKKARKVIAWLGPEAEDSTFALRTLETLASKVVVDWQTSTIKRAPTESPEENWASRNEAIPYDEQTWTAIHDLICRPWFERLWIWQEIRLSSSEALLLCGLECIRWENFRTAVYCLASKDHEPNIANSKKRIDYNIRLKHVLELCDSETSSRLDTLIHQTRHCRCSDPRDRIYAILGMIDKSEADLCIEPDYTKTVREVYKDTVAQCIRKRRTLWILASCGIRDKPSTMPTWVPDWSVPNSCHDLPATSYAGGNSFAEATYDGGDVLKITGVAFATVNCAENILPHDARRTTAEAFIAMQRYVQPDFENRPYIAGGTLLEAFLRTFCCNMFADQYSPPHTTCPDFATTKDAFISNFRQQQEARRSIPPTLSTFLMFVAHYIFGRSLFTTEEGYIGLAPAAARAGDQLCAMLGCCSPLMLRRSKNSKWIVVGSCYVHGLDDGGAFLGHLSPRYQRVSRYHEASGQWYRAYLDQHEGSSRVEDPRLGPLPSGWIVKSHDQEDAWAWYLKDGVEEDRKPDNRSAEDPRWRPEALRERGVDLRVFELI